MGPGCCYKTIAHTPAKLRPGQCGGLAMMMENRKWVLLFLGISCCARALARVLHVELKIVRGSLYFGKPGDEFISCKCLILVCRDFIKRF